MAVLKKLERKSLAKVSTHTEVEGTYTIVHDAGEKYLQIDTYGSVEREIPGKKSQTLRLSRAVIEQLKVIIAENF